MEPPPSYEEAVSCTTSPIPPFPPSSENAAPPYTQFPPIGMVRQRSILAQVHSRPRQEPTRNEPSAFRIRVKKMCNVCCIIPIPCFFIACICAFVIAGRLM
ncbi:hypothetical protein PMAYCL1PPCAC_16780 [Pristionchus mayeri]|uniref:Uncharacterized protein n=1 Tax=Pristionchus mayeri TaxID=1317129 RepID=A0AAN5CLM5_9BILA|nr:hypothetical protein PMAYCL1PPCAC_16780 [Pristionchus mayeri]